MDNLINFRLSEITSINAARTINLDRYREEGCEDRFSWLKCLADDFRMDIHLVAMLADTLGPNEDFDGLVVACEDAELGEFDG